ncbi:MAG TPA: aldo/keto reductase [Desulfobacteraceae bacterium]|nr:aldo/keto reductase [Desulfobacteraceae bacterium]
MTHTAIPKVSFGTTPVTRVGLGGEGVLRTQGRDEDARAVIAEAVAQGIGYYDSARVYMDSEVYYGQYWQANPGERGRVFHTSKSAERTREGALTDLDQTLDRLGTNYLDLWQIHDVRDDRDLDQISARGGALEAFLEARDKGRVKHIGVTGHHDPEILARAVEMWPVDSVLMPVNPVEEILGGFLTRTLEAAQRKGIAVIAMKILGGSHYIARDLGITPELLIRFALSYDITTAIVGCKTPEEVRTLANCGKIKAALTKPERREIMKPFVPMAKKLAFYRGSVFNRP